MARAMNVDKRVETLRAMVAKVGAYSDKAEQIAEELFNSFNGNKTPHGKKALQLSKVATKLSDVLRKAATSITV